MKAIHRWFRAWNEIILLPLAILLWVWSDSFLRWLDPTSAAPYDAGLLQKFVYAMIGTLICHFFTWLMLKLTFPNIFLYIYRRFEFDLLDVTDDKKDKATYDSKVIEKKWVRLRYSFLFFALYLVTFLVVLATV